MRVVEAVAGSDKRPLSFMTFEVLYFDVVFHLIHVENIERNQRTFVCLLSTLATVFGREETGARTPNGAQALVTSKCTGTVVMGNSELEVPLQ